MNFISQEKNPNYQPGEPRRQVSFLGLDKDEKSAKETLDSLKEGNFSGIGSLYNFEAQAKQVEKRRAYNKKVRTLDPLFADLEPEKGLILRCFILTGSELDKQLDNGQILETGVMSLPKIPVLTSNKQAKHREVTDPFAYRPLAVVVSVPKTEMFYKPGDVVQIVHPESYTPIPDNDLVKPRYSYMHPLTKHLFEPTDPDDPEFGYVFMPVSSIIMRLPESQIKDYEF